MNGVKATIKSLTGGAKKKKSKSPKAAQSISAHILGLRAASGSNLKAFLLSAKAVPQKVSSREAPLELSDEDILACLRRHVVGLDTLMSRDGETPAAVYILGTYRAGLPLFNRHPEVQASVVTAMRFILWKVCPPITSTLVPITILTVYSGFKVHQDTPSERVARDAMIRLSEAFTACQAVQGRVIDTLYGELSGRDRGFPDQMLGLVHEVKERALEATANSLNPDAWRQGDDVPAKQLPHILSSYRVAVGEELGLHGVEAARCDYCAKQIQPAEACKVATLLFERFQEEELLQEFIKDINQPGCDRDRRINRTQLAQWVGAEGSARGLDPHRIYYDDARPEQYIGRPAAGEEYEPFLEPEIARSILAAVFLGSA